jgi:hypothetical protein
MTPEQMKLFRIIVTAILEAIHAAGPSGAPAGVLYAALMTTCGWTLSQFESAMGGLVRSGLVRRDGYLYFLSSAGEAVLTGAAS